MKAETFESPVSCKICGKTFASFRGLNGHMNAHLPSHRKRAETFEASWFKRKPDANRKIIEENYHDWKGKKDLMQVYVDNEDWNRHMENRVMITELYGSKSDIRKIHNYAVAQFKNEDWNYTDASNISQKYWERFNKKYGPYREYEVKDGYEAETFEAPKICWECNKEWEYDSRDKSHAHFCHDCSPRPETFEAELDGIELPVCCGQGVELFPYNGDIIITCQGYTQYFGITSRKHYCGQSKRLSQLQDGVLWEDCGYCGGELWDDEDHTFKTTDGLVCKRCYEEHYKEDEDFDAEEPSIVRGTWMGGVVEFSNGDVFVKVITFPVTDDSGFSGESMWVILEEGNEFDGIGILDNDPIHSEIKSGSRIKFAGGTPHYKPHFVAVVEAETFEAEVSEQLPYEIITTDWKSSIAPENRHNNDNWFITGDTIFAVPDHEGHYGRGEETIVRISTYGEGTTLDEAKENGIFRATEYLYDDYSRGYFTQNAETFEADYCNTCKIPDHDSCSLTEDCPCCDNTMAGIYRKRFGAEDESTIEDFFRDMETTLNKYGAWNWDSEARDGDLHISVNLTPTNGENFYQYDLDFDEIREGEGRNL